MMSETCPKPWTPPSPAPARLETERFVIRQYEEADAPALFGAIDASRATMLPWIPWAKTEHLDVAASLESIRKFTAARENWSEPANNSVFGFIFGVFEREGGALVGGTGFNRIDFPALEAETGYWVHDRHRRRGIATEVTAAMLTWAFATQERGGWGFRRVRVLAAAANEASCGVVRKLGLREECRFVQHRWTEGLGWTDTIGWGVLADEWKALRTPAGRMAGAPAQ